jgi:hypothetical protein
MIKIETKIFIYHEDGETVYNHASLCLGAMQGLYGYPAVKMFLETDIKDRTTEEYKDEVRIKHVEIKFVSIKEDMIEDAVKILIGMLELLVEKESIKLTHNYLEDKGE